MPESKEGDSCGMRYSMESIIHALQGVRQV